MSTVTKLAIYHWGTHINAHLDELGGIAIGDEYGHLLWDFEGKLPEIIAFSSDEDLLEQVRDYLNIAFVGRAGTVRGEVKGVVIDEHDAGGRLTDKDGGKTCSAKMMAEKLGVDQLPELSYWIAEILRSDTEPGQGYLEAGLFIKYLYTHGVNVDEQKVYERLIGPYFEAYLKERRDVTARESTPSMTVGIEDLVMGSLEDDQKPKVALVVAPAYCDLDTLTKAYLVQTNGGSRFNSRGTEGEAPAPIKLVFVKNDGELSIFRARAEANNDVVFVGFEDGQFPKSMTVREMAELFDVKYSRKFSMIEKALHRFTKHEPKLFELRQIVEAFNRFGEMLPMQIFLLVQWIFRASAASSYELMVLCKEEFKANGRMVKVRGFKVAVVTSDLNMMSKYCFKKDVMVAIIERPKSGKRVVLANKRLMSDDELLIFSGLMAEEALVLETDIDPEFEKLTDEKFGEVFDQLLEEVQAMAKSGKDQPLPRYSWWYFFPQNGSLFNGTDTVDSQNSAITTDDIVSAVKRALTVVIESRETATAA